MSYYRMHRGWMNNSVISTEEPFTKREAWCWLIENANYSDCEEYINGSVVVVFRGQICKAFRYLARAWKWDESRVRRFCKSLEKASMIECGVAASQSLITICNYDIYQADKCGGAAQTDAVPPQHRRSIAANIKKERKKEDKKENTPPTPQGDGDGFAEFWSAYPRKEAKEAGRRAYGKAVKRATHETIMAGVKRYAAKCVGKDAEFIAHPSTWLNQGRWDDGEEVSKTNSEIKTLYDLETPDETQFYKELIEHHRTVSHYVPDNWRPDTWKPRMEARARDRGIVIDG